MYETGGARAAKGPTSLCQIEALLQATPPTHGSTVTGTYGAAGAAIRGAFLVQTDR